MQANRIARLCRMDIAMLLRGLQLDLITWGLEFHIDQCNYSSVDIARFSDWPSSRPQVRLIFFVPSDCVGHGLGLSRRATPSPHQKPYLPCQRVQGYEHPTKPFNV